MPPKTRAKRQTNDSETSSGPSPKRARKTSKNEESENTQDKSASPKRTRSKSGHKEPEPVEENSIVKQEEEEKESIEDTTQEVKQETNDKQSNSTEISEETSEQQDEQKKPSNNTIASPQIPEKPVSSSRQTHTPKSLPIKQSTSSIPLGAPNQTIYINNLNDKVNKNVLRNTLYMLFSPHGHIISIVALKTPKMRGQAHIAFQDVASATLAIRAMQGIELFGKKMRIVYAKSKSNAVAILDGTFKPSAPGSTTTTTTQQNLWSNSDVKYDENDSDSDMADV